MSTKVTIVPHPETGAVITPTTKNPEIGSIRVESSQQVFNPNTGFFSEDKRTAFIAGRIEDLAKLGWEAGQTVPGKIIRLESFNPFYKGQDMKRYPDNHDNAGEPVLTEGRPTYIRFIFTPNLALQDRWVDNSAVAVQQAESIEQQAI